jgi:hypothetical protein
LRGRDEALLLYLLAIWGVWASKFFDLLPNNAYLSATGLTTVGTATNFSIIASAIGGLLYLFWPSKKTQSPQVVVEYAEEDSQLFTQFEVQLKDRREPIKARFAFVTITNVTGPTINGMEAEFRVSNVVSRKALHRDGPLVFVFSIHSDHLTIHQEDMEIDEFRKVHEVAEHFEAEVANTNDGKLASRTMMLHKGEAKTIGLVLTLEGSDKVFITNYQTRSWVFIPCSFNIGLSFFGNPALSPKPIRFHVQVKDWKSLHVVNWEVHMKRQQEQMRLVYAPLFSAVASLRLDKIDPQRRRTAGTPFNSWAEYSDIRKGIIEVFSRYPDLVENDAVWTGWQDNEPELRSKGFWAGGDVLYKWLEAIEAEYHRIDSDLEARSSSS